MKNIKTLLMLMAILVISAMNTACSKVEAGHVGIKVNLLGSDKGVETEVLGVGRYWIGFNEDLYVFPTFQQNVIWTASKTEGSPNNDSFTFQTKEGLEVNADVAMAYSVNPDKVSVLFQKYRKQLDEITHIYLRNIVRDVLVRHASMHDVEYLYGTGKTEFIKAVENEVRIDMAEFGINIDYISIVGTLRLPKNVVDQINLKIEATQRAQQRENELRETEAEVAKALAKSEGEAQVRIIEAEALAKEILIKAQAQANANNLLAKSINTTLVQYKTIEKWDGILPKLTGDTVPLIDITKQ